MWQYKQVLVDRNMTVEARQAVLDRLGSDGWEFKSVHPSGQRHEVLVFAKQQATESAPSDPGPRPLNG